MNLFINTLAVDPFAFFSWVLVVMFSICVHEYAHARTALRHGDDTAAWLGHLTLDPMVQMGIPSMIILMLFGIAWGAVPVNVHNLHRRSSAAWVAAAGPLANLLLCVIFGAFAVISRLLPWEQVTAFLNMASVANGVLCLFNLLPLPMFDGWAVLSLWIPATGRFGTSQAQSASWIGLFVLWFTPIGGYVWFAGKLLALLIMAGWGALANLLT